MRELPVIEDKRLLGALDYIDERFIAEVTEEYEIFDTAPGAKLPPRARIYRIRQFAVAAACLVLLSVFAAIVPNVANSAIQFLAGAFAEKPYKDYDPHSSPVFDYPLSMSVEDIYDDVMLGGWVVSNDLSCVANSQLVEEFYLKVKDRKPSSLLLAQFITSDEESEYIQTRYDIEYDGQPSIELLEVVYDGEEFMYIFRFIHSATQFEYETIEEYKYLKKTKVSDSSTKYYLTDDINFEYGPSYLASSAPAPRFRAIFTYRAEDVSYERAINAYPEDMPIDEIYADVLKGGWVVQDVDEKRVVVGLELWNEFLQSVEAGEAASVLIVYYSKNGVIKMVAQSSIDPNGEDAYCGSQLYLSELKYDGNSFSARDNWYNPNFGDGEYEYKYLNTQKTSNGNYTQYYLSNYTDRKNHDSSLIRTKDLFLGGMLLVMENE